MFITTPKDARFTKRSTSNRTPPKHQLSQFAEGVEVWLDASLKLYETVHLACGDDRTTIELTPDETEQASGAQGWVDVTKA